MTPKEISIVARAMCESEGAVNWSAYRKVAAEAIRALDAYRKEKSRGK